MTSSYEKPRTFKTEGVVLRQASSGEADRMLTVYTRDFGMLRLVARGLRRPNSRLAGHLEPLVHASLQLARGRGPDVVTGADTLHGHTALRSNLEGIARGLVCAELIDAFAPEEQANPELFRLLLHALDMLNEGDGDLLLWHFAFHVLALTGYMPELQQCVMCGRQVEPDEHLFTPGLGGVVCSRCARGGDPGGPQERAGAPLLPLSVNALKVMRFFRDHPYDEVRGLRIDGALSRELERVEGGDIRYLLEREVRSAEFLSRLSRLLPAGG
ncbi:MAG: DNA repair protein RecO [Chloroflexi bacterium]|nr:DNA repair protein RecO [Chloroflexota bacterium]